MAYFYPFYQRPKSRHEELKERARLLLEQARRDALQGSLSTVTHRSNMGTEEDDKKSTLTSTRSFEMPPRTENKQSPQVWGLKIGQSPTGQTLGIETQSLSEKCFLLF